MTELPGGLDLASTAQSGFEFSADSTITRWSLVGFIGSNYSFFPGDDEEEEPQKID